MNGRLAQLLRYLERDGVTEVLLRVGHPVSMRTATGSVDVTARALSSEQLEAIVRDTDLALLMASRVPGAMIELQAGTVRAVARVTRGDDGIAVTLTRAAIPPPPPAAPPIEPPTEFDVELELELDPPMEDTIALAAEEPVPRSRANPSEMPAPVDRGSPFAPVRNPILRDGNSTIQRIDPHAGPSSGAFQRVDLRDARAPTPRPDPIESTEDSSAWADIDLAPPSRKR